MSSVSSEADTNGEAPADPSTASSTVVLEVPFGQRLVRENLATEEQVEEAVKLQEEMARRGVFLRLGELLVARGVVDEESVAKVLSLQGTAILVCSSCYAQYNVVAYAPNKRYRCQRCREVLTQPDALEEVAVEDTLVAEEWKDAFDLDGDGERTLGDYQILGRISRGGMGIIYKARQKRLDRLVAMKVLILGPDDAGDHESARQDFRKEAQAVASLRHPHIVAVHDVGRAGEVDYFTMDYVEGLPINRALATAGLSEREIVEVCVKLCAAVSYAHSQGLLHRDLKPENVLLDRRGEPVLIDFGIARGFEESEDGGKIIGSPGYLPPEYIAGTHPYDLVGEVYSLAATLYTLLAGRPPRDGVDTVQVLRKASTEPVRHIRHVRRTVSKDLATIVMTALAQERRHRYQTVSEFENDLRRWLEGDEIALRAGPMERAWNRIRGKVAATIGLGVALILPVSTGYFSWQLKASARQSEEAQRQHARERKELLQELVTTRIELARSLAAQGKKDLARQVLGRLRSRPLDGERKAEVEQLLEALGN
ncbi:MAG TPA: hypothetical protein DEA08_18615 [Planctomycetes bacterium]|nr:hypothetical protein [Planctomycetota bacterium]